VTWGGWHVPPGVELCVIGLFAAGALTVAIVQFGRIE
jgi:hypothetical protein